MRVARWIAWHLPRSVVYWCGVRLFAEATSGRYGNESPDEVSVMDALRRHGGDEA